jgi:hypothetical protein
MNPAGTRGSGGGAAASGPSNGISSGISNGISNGTRVREGWGAGGERSDTSGFPRAAPQKEASPTPGSGSGLKTPAMDPAGTRGLEAARWPHGRVTVLVAVLVTALVTVLASAKVGGRAGRDRTRPGFLERLRRKKPRPLRIRGAGSKPRRWVVMFTATWAAAKDGGGDRWQRPGPSRRTPKAPGDRLSPAEQRH